jgi:pyridoxamine 5'-phosphate oxidase
MKKSIAQLRRSYEKAKLTEDSVCTDPFEQFQVWFDQNLKINKDDPTAMALATVDKKGMPANRIVLLKDYNREDGFSFYTNYDSRKAKQLKDNPKASLLFYWPQTERQIRIEGKIKKLSKAISEAYFHQRPRESQIGAWASEQSSTIPDRNYLEKTVSDLTRFFDNHKQIPLPPFWGGYSLIPSYFEFWQGRPNRLHDRIIYTLVKGSWKIGRLAP